MELWRVGRDMRGLVTAALAAAAVVTFAYGLWLQRQAREVARLASPLMACPEANLEVESSEHTDTSERHVVRGCGVRITMLCAAPDAFCVAETRETVTRPGIDRRSP